MGNPIPPWVKVKRKVYQRTVLFDQITHLVLDVAAQIPEAKTGMDTRLDVAADFLMNLGRLAQTRLDLRNIHMTESLLRLRRSLPVITFNIVVDSSRRKSVRIDVIHLEINNPMIKTRIVKSFGLLSLRNVALQDGTT